jgi:hypothetical protein
MALDLESNEGRVVQIRLSVKRASLQYGRYEPQVLETEPPGEAYSSFGEFVADSIQANKNNEPMACFRLGTKPVVKSTLLQSEPTRVVAPQIAGTNTKVIPVTENALVLRTDFSDEPAWESLCDVLQDPEDEFSPSFDFVSDRAYEGVTADQLPTLLPEDSSISFAFLIDRNTVTHRDHPILAIDLQDQPGRTFRVTPEALGDVANNLSIANMDFDEFAKAVDQDGIFRGFSRP